MAGEERGIGLLNRIALFVATAGGVGYSPIAPGTAGSLLALIILWVVPFSSVSLAVAVVVLAGVGGWAAGRAERLLGGKDPAPVVIDEIAGMFLSVLPFPRSLGLLLAAFLLFRVLDIVKPFPIRQCQILSGGLGVILDDLLAGVYTLGILWALLALVGRAR